VSTVRVAQTFTGTVHEAERCWYDTDAWSAWVDGLAHVQSVEGNWPEVGAIVRWESGPAGRGRVTEKVIAYEALTGQTNEVLDDAITGRQTVTFTPDADGGEDAVTVEFALEYRLRRRSVVTPVVDLLFIRRAMTMSLRSTLSHFGAQLAHQRTRNGHAA
jgi:hypothetical protein